MKVIRGVKRLGVLCLLLVGVSGCGLGEKDCTEIDAYRFDADGMCLLSREKVSVGCYPPPPGEDQGLGATQCIHNDEANLLVWDGSITEANGNFGREEPGYEFCSDELHTQILLSTSAVLSRLPDCKPQDN